MPDVILSDAVSLAGTRRRTSAGFMVADCRFARGANVQVYSGKEAGRPDMETVRVYRPEDVVFDADTMARWAFKPVTVGHPVAGTVTSDNWRDEAVGFAGSTVARDGEFVTVGLGLMDAAAIEAVEQGTTELSAGYLVALDYAPGTTPGGEAYDAKITKLAPNHIAIVPKGRAGGDCRIGDAAPAKPTPTPQQPRRKDQPPMAGENDNGRAVILVDGFTVATTPQGVEAIQRLQRQMNDAAAANETARASLQTALDSANGQVAALRTAHDQALAAKDGEIAGLRVKHDAALKEATDRIAALEAEGTPAALEARAAARAQTITVAKRAFGDAFTGAGMSDADIRKATVVKAMGTTLTDADTRPQVFFDSAFEVVAAAVPAPAAPPKPDPLRAALAAGAGALALDAAQQKQAEPTAYEKNLRRLQSAWMGNDEKGAA